MTAPTVTSPLTDIPFHSLLSSVPPIIASDSSPEPRVTHYSTSTPSTSGTDAAGTSESSTIATSPCHGLSNSKLTAVIVVPIILLAILSPILIVWFLSWRRRRRHWCYNRRSIRKDVKLEREKEREKEKDTVGFPPQARQPRSSPPKRGTASLPPPSRRPFTTTPDKRESTQQLRTSRIPNHSLSGFDFDFSRRATMFSARSTQPTIRDPSVRQSSAYTWILPPPSASRPMTLAQPYIPPRVQTPILPECPLAPQQLDQTYNINLEVSSQSSTEVLPHPDSYGKVHKHASSTCSLSVENLSVHNSSNLQAPFSQPHPDAVSEMSDRSFYRSLWVTTQQAQCDPDVVSPLSEVSALDADPNSSINPHQTV